MAAAATNPEETATDHGLPGFVYPLMFLGGSLPLWPFLARLRSRWLRAVVLGLPLVEFLLPVTLPWNWLLVAPTLIALQAGFAVLFLLFIPPLRRARPPGGAGERLRRGLALAAAGLPFGLILVGMEQWLTDALWSSYYPVNSSIDSISQEVGAAWVLFAVVLAFSAFHVSPWLRPATPLRVLRLLFWTFAAYLVVHQLYLVLVAIPEWQTDVREIFPPWVVALRELVFQLLVYAGVPAALGSLFRRRGRAALREFGLSLASVALALVALAWVSGMPIHDALLLGQNAEKSGRPARAIPWYGRALTWSQSDKLKSYLQFHVGLLYRKTGKLEAARDAFLRVLVRYPHDEDLLADADEFKDKLQVGAGTRGRRVVIPGIEARTEYKAAYCVPNSLGLILNFWGDRLGAKKIGSEITELDRGSLLTDEVYFAEERGFTSLVLPLCTLQQVFRLIDHGIPVLAFIPGHVLAVFGYDQALGTLVTYDVSTFDIWDDERWNDFGSDWCKTFNTLGVVVPKAMLPAVRAVLGSDVEQRSEAYLQYLLASMTEGDPDLREHRMRRALGRGFFPADWDYHALFGDTSAPSTPDSEAVRFLLAHETGDDPPMDFAADCIWRGHPDVAIDFLQKLGTAASGGLSPQLLTALAAAELSRGQTDSAVATLAQTPPETLDPASAAFLLRAAEREGIDDDAWVERLSQDLLGREELRGDEARLAFAAWRRNADVGPRNLDGVLDQTQAYLDQWEPYDTTAIVDLRLLLGRKVFRPGDELAQHAWHKQDRLLHMRLTRLRWAAEEPPPANGPRRPSVRRRHGS